MEHRSHHHLLRVGGQARLYQSYIAGRRAVPWPKQGWNKHPTNITYPPPYLKLNPAPEYQQQEQQHQHLVLHVVMGKGSGRQIPDLNRTLDHGVAAGLGVHGQPGLGQLPQLHVHIGAAVLLQQQRQWFGGGGAEGGAGRTDVLDAVSVGPLTTRPRDQGDAYSCCACLI